MTSLSEQLKNLRRKNDVSQKVLAENIGIAQSAIANYESGYRVPNHEILIKLADYFDITLDELMCRVHEKTDWIEISDIFLKSMMKKEYQAAYALLEHMIDNGASVEEIYLKVFRYALAKIGWLWETGMITSADEHFITRQIDVIMDAVYQKVIAIKSKDVKAVKVLGMAAPHEQHTMPIKMIMHLLSFEGMNTFMIGSSVPVEALSDFVQKNEIDLIILSITMQEFADDLKTYLDEVRKNRFLSKKMIIIGGKAAKSIKIEDESVNLKIVLKYEEILEVIK